MEEQKPCFGGWSLFGLVLMAYLIGAIPPSCTPSSTSKTIVVIINSTVGLAARGHLACTMLNNFKFFNETYPNLE